MSGAASDSRLFDGIDEAAAECHQRGSSAGSETARPALTVRLKATPLQEVPIVRTEWLEPGYIPKGKLVLTEGHGDLGKTTMIMAILAAHTCGRRFFPCAGDEAQRYPVQSAIALIIAREDDHSTIKARLREAGVDESRVFMIDGRELVNAEGIVEEADGSIYLPRDMAPLEAIIQEKKASIVYVDALHSHVTVDNPKDPTSVRLAYQQIVDLLNRMGVTLIGNRHWGKGSGPAHDRGLGSSEIGHIARAVLSFAKHPRETKHYVVTQTKGNLSRAMPTLVYRIDIIEATDDAGRAFTVPKVVITGTDADIRPDDVALALPLTHEERSRIQEAREAMVAAFAGVSTLPVAVLDGACEGIAQRTIERARGLLVDAGLLTRGLDGKVGQKDSRVTYTIHRDRLARIRQESPYPPYSEVADTTRNGRYEQSSDDPEGIAWG
jgi:hypothetical protein